MACDSMYSKYFEQLDDKSKIRYREKVAVVGNSDPYCLKKQDSSTDGDHYPRIANSDIVNYMLFAPSPWTREEVKCYKSLGSCNQFLSGCVRKLKLYR